jgi:putative thioredoxin
VDVTDATFQSEVIERSHELPVIVDFWAPWCGPCRQLAPVLEQAVERFAGEVVLAKVNIDENPAAARAHRVQSIPFVKAFRDGRAVSEFVGAQPPASVDAFVLGLVPSTADRLVAEGDEASLREAMEVDPGHVGARLALGALLQREGRIDEMREVLVPVAFEPLAAGLIARADLATDPNPDVAAGLAHLDADRVEQGLTHLLDAVRGATDPERRDALRAVMVGAFTDLGEHHPLTVRFRKRLAQALY